MNSHTFGSFIDVDIAFDCNEYLVPVVPTYTYTCTYTCTYIHTYINTHIKMLVLLNVNVEYDLSNGASKFDDFHAPVCHFT